EAVVLANPLGEANSAVRTTILPGLLTVAAYNLRHGAKHLALFEIGPVVHKEKAEIFNNDPRTKDLPQEDVRIAFLLLGGRYQGSWFEKGDLWGVGDAMGLIETIYELFDLEERLVREAKAPSGWHPSASARLFFGEKEVGVAGQIHPDVAKGFGLKEAVFAGEISLGALRSASVRDIAFHPLAKFPGTRRDIALLADKTIAAADIRDFLRQRAGGDSGSELVRDVWLFDVYEGKNLPEGQVSLAFAIEYQSPERTLNDDEVNKAFNEVIEELKTEFKVEIRS
ncbi:hypothetical protein KAI87_10135, partial [Myxococcota bacterium]|nr:hypothetical protein [Myxococcota bacterium]